MTHICVNKIIISRSDNGLSPGRHQAIIWTNAGILHNNTWTLGNNIQWNFDRNWYIYVKENALEYVVCKMASISSRSQCVNVFLPNCIMCKCWPGSIEVNEENILIISKLIRAIFACERRKIVKLITWPPLKGLKFLKVLVHNIARSQHC